MYFGIAADSDRSAVEHRGLKMTLQQNLESKNVNLVSERPLENDVSRFALCIDDKRKGDSAGVLCAVAFA